MSKVKYPKIYLVLDNCFAIKRWVKPQEWMKLAKELGFRYVQASTDNEIDPLFHPLNYIDGWFKEVKKLQEELDIKVVNFYTGYQTYRTVGLTHPNLESRRKLIDEWFKRIIPGIRDLGAKGLGMHMWAITQEVLQQPHVYMDTLDLLYDELAEIADYARQYGELQISYEQMYDPHLPPFTIQGAKEFITEIYSRKQSPSFVTIDVGHMGGQAKFLRPSQEEIYTAIRKNEKKIWLGSNHAYQLFEQAIQGDRCEIGQIMDEILVDMDRHRYLFSNKEDTDVYRWIEELGCYSPIFHLQQTNGITSTHAPFTPENNEKGIIRGDLVLEAIAKSYEKYAENPIEPTTDNIYLSFEIFAGNTETETEILEKLKYSIDYWRTFIPEDGLTVDSLLK